MKTISAKEFDKNPSLSKTVEPDNDFKNWLVEYVGQALQPDDQNVTVEMIIEVMASEFPEIVLALAEENWVRGYQQGLEDIEAGMKLSAEIEEKSNENKKSCKLCEKSE
tara:strand:+ start:52 stop:378 length:327 start_codon:yes stop_codon:yes gene_type:complete